MKTGKKKNTVGKLIRKYHKWPSIVMSLFILIFSVSGIVMNHRSLFSGIDVPRKFLLKDYQLQNWNNSSLRSALAISKDSILVYGNMGIWVTNRSYDYFKNFNNGFPKGIDNRKVYKLLQLANGELFAGTLTGLFQYNLQNKRWEKIEIPVKDERVVDLMEMKETLFVLTRSYLLRSEDDGFSVKTLPLPENYNNKEGLFKTLWVIHSGEIAGHIGKLFVDLLGLILTFLTISGLIYWIFPKWIKKRKQKDKANQRIIFINRLSLKWHNKIGVWTIGFLIITTLTGMFLRPPLLIAIANSSVGKIPFTILDSPNPWFDKLRRIIYDDKLEKMIIGTNQGIYYSDKDFTGKMRYAVPQPPVSVMGINVMDTIPNGNFLIGSFNGLFLWNPMAGQIMDVMSPDRPFTVKTTASPLSENMISGYFSLENSVVVVDYNSGAVTVSGDQAFPEMPDHIIDQSPMSLWNLALEFHTGRYYQFMFGRLYILFIPLFGIAMLTILISGFWLWWKLHRK